MDRNGVGLAKMLKALAFGIVLGLGITATGAALAQKPLRLTPADTPRVLLVDDDDKHKNKHNKHFNKHRDEDEDRDEDDNRSRRSSSRTSRSSSSSSQGSYGSSPYYGAPRGYGSYDQPYYGYPAPYYPYGR
jgi:hypothetical protein